MRLVFEMRIMQEKRKIHSKLNTLIFSESRLFIHVIIRNLICKNIPFVKHKTFLARFCLMGKWFGLRTINPGVKGSKLLGASKVD